VRLGGSIACDGDLNPALEVILKESKDSNDGTMRLHGSAVRTPVFCSASQDVLRGDMSPKTRPVFLTTALHIAFGCKMSEVQILSPRQVSRRNSIACNARLEVTDGLGAANPCYLDPRRQLEDPASQGSQLRGWVRRAPAKRASGAMMRMVKLDIAALEVAYAGSIEVTASSTLLVVFPAASLFALIGVLFLAPLLFLRGCLAL
jgi:hypothetical protein